MNKYEKAMPMVLIAILLFLIAGLCYEVFNYIDFENQKDAGNERWKQVEERIQEIEECCECGRDS